MKRATRLIGDWTHSGTGTSHHINSIAPRHMKTINTRRVFPLIALLLGLGGLAPVLTGCSGETNAQAEESHGNEGHDHEGHDHASEDQGSDEHGHGSEEGLVHVDPSTISQAGIEVKNLSLSNTTTSFTLPGVVAPVADNIAKVGTILPGRVAALYAREGSYVTKGTRLAEIETIEIGKAKAEYLEAVARETRARQNFDRQNRLAGEQIGAERTLESATAEYNQATALRKEAEAHLRSLGISPDETGASFSNKLTVRAPISGVVSQRTITLGEYVGLDTDMFVIVNTKTVWINAEATPAQAARLGVGDAAYARLATGEKVDGKVFFISPTVNPESRTVTVRLQVANPNGTFRPGTFVTTGITSTTQEKALQIPTAGIEREDGRFFVYRQHDSLNFERVEVDAEEGPDNTMIIRSGISPDDPVAVAGLFYLRSIRMKGELAEHNHSH